MWFVCYIMSNWNEGFIDFVCYGMLWDFIKNVLIYRRVINS